MHSHLQIRDLGILRYFLGIEIARSKEGIYLSQCKYSLEFIAEMGVAGAKPFDTPMKQNKKLTSSALHKISHPSALISDPLLSDPGSYQRLIVRLVYLTITRPDICYVVQTLSQFMNSPKQSHMDAAMRVVRYLKNNPGLGIQWMLLPVR